MKWGENYKNTFGQTTPLQKFKKALKKLFLMILFFLVGIGVGSYVVISGGVDKPYTFVYRLIQNDTDAAEYKFAPIFKESRTKEVEK